MSRILLQTTITENPDDWDVSRFSLLAAELRAAGHSVVARNRAAGNVDDPVLGHLDELGFDQLWLMAVDVGTGLRVAEADAVVRFRNNGGGVLTARDHEQLGSCLRHLGSLGAVNRFHDASVDPETMLDDRGTPDISWPNYHSGANGDYQPVLVGGPVHPVLRTTRTRSGRIEWFPAHPHEGLVSADVPNATVVARGGVWSPSGPSTSPWCSTASARPTVAGWAERWRNPPSTTSPITTGTSTAALRRSSANSRGPRSRPIPRVCSSSRTTCATSPPGCTPRGTHTCSGTVHSGGRARLARARLLRAISTIVRMRNGA